MTIHISRLNALQNMLSSLSLATAVLLLLSVVAPAQAVIITQPAGLNPGAPYRLVFVTSGEIAGREFIRGTTTPTGGPSNISGYNDFATNSATSVAELNALGTTWSAIVSTVRPTNVNARVNTGTDGGGGAAIYNLAGELVASNNADLWDGTIANAIDVTELGGPPADQGDGDDFLVWTGTTSSGDSSNDWSLVSPTGGWMYYGNTALTDTTGTGGSTKSWVGSLGGEPGWDANANTNEEMPIYVMSGVLEATAAIPEPASFALSTVALLGLLALGRRRRR